LISDILVRFCERIPFAWVVIYAMDHVGVSAFEVGLLVAIEMGVAMLFFVPSAALADRYGKEPFVIATFLFFTLFPLTLLFARNFRRLVIAFVVRGLKEFGEPARKALIIQLSPQERRAETIGSYYLLRDVAVTAGSLVGSFLWSIGPEANFLSACALGAAGTVVYWLVAKDRPAIGR
jgi:predicted MFS family arabinose efflux permease